MVGEIVMYGVAGNISPGYTLAIEEDILFETCAREAVLRNGFSTTLPPVQSSGRAGGTRIALAAGRAFHHPAAISVVKVLVAVGRPDQAIFGIIGIVDRPILSQVSAGIVVVARFELIVRVCQAAERFRVLLLGD